DGRAVGDASTPDAPDWPLRRGEHRIVARDARGQSAEGTITVKGGDEERMAIDFVTGLIWFASFLFSTTVHEAMHALAAWRLGDPTAYNGGQVTLSPAPHVAREPVGMLLVPLVTSLTQGWAIGWASCPYDPRWAERYPSRAAMMAAAGPFGNFMIAVAAFLVIRSGLAFGWFVAPETVSLDSIVESATHG